MVAAFSGAFGQFGVVLHAISGFWPHLSSRTLVWQPIEG